jgi:hypothetical protein
MKKVPVKLKKGFVFGDFIGWVPLPRTIIYKNGYTPNKRFVAHELCHVVQYEKYGWKFLPVYVWQWVTSGFSYMKIPMEMEARYMESDPEYLSWAEEVLRQYGFL